MGYVPDTTLLISMTSDVESAALCLELGHGNPAETLFCCDM